MFKAIVPVVQRMSFRTHLCINIVMRLILIGFGELQDNISEVQYTDVDYKVVTDGARHILENESPYQRHTYRYTPLLAYLLIPNVIVHKCIGKLVFSMFDLLVGVVIREILYDEFTETFRQNSAAVRNRLNNTMHSIRQSAAPIRLPESYKHKALISSLVWLYNPLTMVIATRGNGDSITSFLVLAAMYFLLKPDDEIGQYFIAGLLHGLAIHFRLYPIVFSLSFYLYAAAAPNETKFLKLLLKPNQKQMCLLAGTLVSLVGLTVVFYEQYGHTFLHESYLYHLVRKDTRHNFSLYFYMQYLSAGHAVSLLEKGLTLAPQLIILLCSSVHFSRNRKVLPFGIFIQACTMVAFNSVVTSQYFVWFLSVLPLCLKNLSRINFKTAISYTVLWLLTQGAWLLSAYFLEFKGWNTFHLIWMHGCIFFCANIFLMQRLIVNFNVIADFKLKDL